MYNIKVEDFIYNFKNAHIKASITLCAVVLQLVVVWKLFLDLVHFKRRGVVSVWRVLV